MHQVVFPLDMCFILWNKKEVVVEGRDVDSHTGDDPARWVTVESPTPQVPLQIYSKATELVKLRTAG